MKSVLMFDTGVATLNTGDEIINYSIKKNWPEIYNDNYIMTFPTHTPSFHWWQNLLMKKTAYMQMLIISFYVERIYYIQTC